MSRKNVQSRAIWLTVALAGALTAAGAMGQTPSPETPNAAPQTTTKNEDTNAPSQKNSPRKEDQDLYKTDAQHNHRVHVHLGGIYVGAGYSHFSRPYGFGPFWPYRYYPYRYGFGFSAFYGDPFWGPYPYGPYSRGFAFAPDKGEVKLNVEPRSAEVFIDGAYAGTADHLKNLWLEPGAYDLTISTHDRAPFHQRIYVLSGKSLKIAARLSPVTNQDQPKTEEK